MSGGDAGRGHLSGGEDSCSDMAELGRAGLAAAELGVVEHGEAWLGVTGLGVAWLGTMGLGVAWLGTTGLGDAGCDVALLGGAVLGVALLGVAARAEVGVPESRLRADDGFGGLAGGWRAASGGSNPSEGCRTRCTPPVTFSGCCPPTPSGEAVRFAGRLAVSRGVGDELSSVRWYEHRRPFRRSTPTVCHGLCSGRSGYSRGSGFSGCSPRSSPPTPRP